MQNWVDFAAIKRSVELAPLLRQYQVKLRRSGPHAAIIRSSSNYHEGEEVRLDACNTGVNPGGGSFAQQLADALHAPVLGPDNYVWQGGGVTTPFVAGRIPLPNADPTDKEPWLPDYSKPGQYILFLPQGYHGDFNQIGSPIG